MLERVADPKWGADRIERALRQLYVAEHELVQVDAKDFRHLDLAFYDATAKTLAEHGFRTVADIEDKTISGKQGSRRTFVRCLTDDESIDAAVYNHQLSAWLHWLAPNRKSTRIVDLESELSDGNFLTTSTAWTSRHLKSSPRFDRAFLRPDTPVDELLAEHRKRLQGYISQHPDSKPVVSTTLEDVFASAQRSYRIKAEFRAQGQYRITREELTGIAQDRLSPGREKAANDIADAAEGRAPTASARQPGSPLLLALCWLLLVAAFVVMYRWTAN